MNVSNKPCKCRTKWSRKYGFRVVMVFNATFNNISFISPPTYHK